MTQTIFTLAIFSSATLLFLVQPLVGRFLLPLLGGSAGVWNTCMVFFQATLLLGYLYADLLTRRCSLAVQLAIHAGVLAAAAACLPLSTQPAAAEGSPTLWLLQTLAVSVGPPFFALCATAPLLQRWFSQTRDRTGPVFPAGGNHPAAAARANCTGACGRTLIQQSSPWGYLRDWWFECYQLHLPMIFGSLGWSSRSQGA